MYSKRSIATRSVYALITILLPAVVSCEQKKAPSILLKRMRNRNGVIWRMEVYQQAHDGRMPSKFSDLWNEKDQSVLAELFWPKWLEESIGARPAAWPLTPEQLDANLAYQWVDMQDDKGQRIIIVESEKMTALSKKNIVHIIYENGTAMSFTGDEFAKLKDRNTTVP
jgi:hypothetical protein